MTDFTEKELRVIQQGLSALVEMNRLASAQIRKIDHMFDHSILNQLTDDAFELNTKITRSRQ